MLEARAFVENFDEAKKVLESQNAILRGEYGLLDIIFAPKDPKKSLANEFLRLRVYSKNIWDEKDFIVAIKVTEVKDVGKNSIIPLRKEFDSKEEAQKFIEDNLLDKFQYAFEFGRTGWQYDLGGDQVDLEEIEGIYSIEVKSKTEEGLKNIVNLFHIKDTIKGPSVVAVKELLKR